MEQPKSQRLLRYRQNQSIDNNWNGFPTNRDQQPQNWRTWPSLRVRALDLPPEVTTNEIYQNFEQYGSIVYITILEHQRGGISSTAEINFEPVPNVDFWGRARIRFYRYHGTTRDASQGYDITVKLDRYQKIREPIKSPANPDIRYPERIDLLGSALDFGILSAPRSMVSMHICADGPEATKLTLDLKRKVLEVHFKFTQVGSSGAKVRQFRFFIALDDQFDM